MSVVAFPSKEPPLAIWRCNCGCTTHEARSDAQIECASCGALASDLTGDWRSRLPEAPTNAVPVAGSDTRVVDLDDPAVGLRAMLRRADVSNLAAVIVVENGGAVRVHSVAPQGDAQMAWVDSRLAEAGAMWKRG